MVATLWKIFLELILVFLILIVIYVIISFMYNVTIGAKKEEKRKAKAKEDLLKKLQELAKELGTCECEKKAKETTKKSSKKEK